MALTLDGRVESVLHSGGQGWCMLLKIRDLAHLRQKIIDCCATVDPNMLSKLPTNMVKRPRKCVKCRGQYIEHIM
jgi:hypothetical protein